MISFILVFHCINILFLPFIIILLSVLKKYLKNKYKLTFKKNLIKSILNLFHNILIFPKLFRYLIKTIYINILSKANGKRTIISFRHFL